MKNRLGDKFTLETAKSMWEQAKVNAFHEWGMDPLDEKACEVFYDRLYEAEKRGASEEELFAIDARDVTLTLWDLLCHWIDCTVVGSFLLTFHYWYTIDPCYWH